MKMHSEEKPYEGINWERLQDKLRHFLLKYESSKGRKTSMVAVPVWKAFQI